jgi:hypothetical protein
LLLAWNEPAPDGRINPVLEVEAEGGVVEQRTQSGSLKHARGRIYRSGVLRATFTAPRVEADMAAQRVVAEGGVQIDGVAPAGLTLRAVRIVWKPELNRIVAQGEVRFEKRDPATGRLEAEGGPFERMTIDTELQKLTVP